MERELDLTMGEELVLNWPLESQWDVAISTRQEAAQMAEYTEETQPILTAE